MALSRDGRLTVLWDRDCTFCRATVRRLTRWDRHLALEFVPLQDAAADPRLAWVAAAHPLRDALHVVDARGRVAAGGAAALTILDALPGGWLLRPWAALPPARRAADMGYRVVARNRDRLGRWLRLEPTCYRSSG